MKLSLTDLSCSLETRNLVSDAIRHTYLYPNNYRPVDAESTDFSPMSNIVTGKTVYKWKTVVGGGGCIEFQLIFHCCCTR